MVSNDEDLVKLCSNKIQLAPCERNLRSFSSKVDIDEYRNLLGLLFRKSDYLYAHTHNDFYAISGAQQFSPVGYNVWVSFTNNFEDYKTDIYRTAKRGIQFLEKNISIPEVCYAESVIYKDFREGLYFNLKLGFEIVEYDSGIFKLWKRLGASL